MDIKKTLQKEHFGDLILDEGIVWNGYDKEGVKVWSMSNWPRTSPMPAFYKLHSVTARNVLIIYISTNSTTKLEISYLMTSFYFLWKFTKNVNVTTPKFCTLFFSKSTMSNVTQSVKHKIMNRCKWKVELKVHFYFWSESQDKGHVWIKTDVFSKANFIEPSCLKHVAYKLRTELFFHYTVILGGRECLYQTKLQIFIYMWHSH